MARRTVYALLLCGCLVASLNADEPTGQRAPLPADLRAVPADALGFVHIRVADIWNSDSLKDYRDTLRKAGEKAIAGFDKRFVPHPSSIERLTLVLITQDREREPLAFAILAVNQAIDKEEFRKSALPNAVLKESKGGGYYLDEKSHLAVAFVNDRTIAFGPSATIQAYRSRAWKTDGGLSEALHLANSKRPLVAAFNGGVLPAKAFEEAPAPFHPLLRAKLLTLAVDATAELRLDVGLTFEDAKPAAEAHDAIKALAAAGRNEIKAMRKGVLEKVVGDGKVAPLGELSEAAMALFALSTLEQIDEILAKPPIQHDGRSLRASVKLPGGLGALNLGTVALSSASVYFFRYLDVSKHDRAKLEILLLDRAVKTYIIKNDGVAPDNLSQVLIFIENADKSKLLDPWGKPYQYRFDATSFNIMIQTTAPDGTVIDNSRPKR